MTRGLAAVFAFLCLAWPTSPAVAGGRGGIVVRVSPGTTTAYLRGDLSARGLSLGARIPHTDLYAVGTGGRTPTAALRLLRGASHIVGAEPDHVVRAFEMPNDPFFHTAESYLSTLRLPQAWDLTHGSLGVVVAVVDTGVTPVADLSTQVLPGRNFVTGNAEARDDSLIGHGTLVAGVAAATTNNDIGIAGAAWNASVLPVKVLDARGFGTDSQVAAGMIWAADHGADVINLSLGGPASNVVLCDAVSYAQSRGSLVVASAGNFADGRLNYPAACPGVVAVSATDAQGDFASFSSYGPDISLAAPGLTVTSTRNDNRYGTESGTSFSAPMVSGVAALVIAQHPDWSASQVAQQLEETAQDRGPRGVDPYYGHGLLDAYAALGGPLQAAEVPTRDALEPNDDDTLATRLQKVGSATIVPEGDVDWYVTSLRWPARFRFDVVAPRYNAYTGPNLRPVAELYDANLNVLATAGPDAQRARLAFRLPAGLYYLRVANGYGARSAGAYSVSLSVRRSRGIVAEPMP
jgi:subtilisin family serine protease